MSRIGVQPVRIVHGVEVTILDGVLRVKGPKGVLEQKIALYTRIEIGDGEARVLRDGDHKRAKAAHGLMRSLLANMVTGVTDGFSKTLDIVGVGYRAAVAEKMISLNLGFSHEVNLEIPADLDVIAESPTRIVVRGADKQRVGQFAADVRQLRAPEPYKGKGIRYLGEHIRRKVGKSAAGV